MSTSRPDPRPQGPQIPYQERRARQHADRRQLAEHARQPPAEIGRGPRADSGRPSCGPRPAICRRWRRRTWPLPPPGTCHGVDRGQRYAVVLVAGEIVVDEERRQPIGDMQDDQQGHRSPPGPARRGPAAARARGPAAAGAVAVDHGPLPGARGPWPRRSPPGAGGDRRPGCSAPRTAGRRGGWRRAAQPSSEWPAQVVEEIEFRPQAAAGKELPERGIERRFVLAARRQSAVVAVGVGQVQGQRSAGRCGPPCPTTAAAAPRRTRNGPGPCTAAAARPGPGGDRGRLHAACHWPPPRSPPTGRSRPATAPRRPPRRRQAATATAASISPNSTRNPRTLTWPSARPR